MTGIQPMFSAVRTAANTVTDLSSQRQFSVQHQPKMDRLDLRFGAARNIPAPNTIEGSQYINDRLSISGDVLNDLVATLDACMTVVGESYSGNEAFTTLLQVDFTDKGKEVLSDAKPLNAAFDSAVEFAEKNRMVITSQAKKNNFGTLAQSKATFVAVNPASVGPGKKMQTESVQAIDIKPHEQTLSDKARDWNADLSGFYKNVSIRLGTRDKEVEVDDLANLKSSKTRLINRSVYVTPDMLNKKRTGHGGIAAANAVKDMQALVENLGYGKEVETLTASFQSPFYESDALQFDTTLDLVDGNDLYLSTRIYRFDTKGFDEAKPDERNRRIEGPVILVNAKINTSDYTAAQAREALKEQRVGTVIDDTPAKEEAKLWKELIKQ